MQCTTGLSSYPPFLLLSRNPPSFLTFDFFSPSQPPSQARKEPLDHGALRLAVEKADEVAPQDGWLYAWPADEEDAEDICRAGVLLLLRLEAVEREIKSAADEKPVGSEYEPPPPPKEFQMHRYRSRPWRSVQPSARAAGPPGAVYV